MISIQQLLNTLRKLNALEASDLLKFLKQIAATPIEATTIATTTTTTTTQSKALEHVGNIISSSSSSCTTRLAVTSSPPSTTTTATKTTMTTSALPQQYESTVTSQLPLSLPANANAVASAISYLNENGCCSFGVVGGTQELLRTRNQDIQKFYQLQIIQHFHTQHTQHSTYAKQKQTHFAMSSLAAAEPSLSLNNKQDEMIAAVAAKTNGTSCHDDAAILNTASAPAAHHPATAAVLASESSSPAAAAAATTTGKPCFNAGLAEILQFMELIGNLKHTKRTGWVLRDVNDCESISGHMYRMSILTFLLDGSEGLNQIRCMELALVHDLAESLVGDITPFCGVSKDEKRAMEFKAMDDICKLIEPRGKRIMELFQEYEHGESAESKFVKDLDRLDMVMQAFEYEKRDDCLLKHQEFFDSTEGKFNHPFVKKLVNEIYEQRKLLAKAKGATPPPYVQVPSMEAPHTEVAAAAAIAAAAATAINGHHCATEENTSSSPPPPPSAAAATTTTSNSS